MPVGTVLTRLFKEFSRLNHPNVKDLKAFPKANTFHLLYQASSAYSKIGARSFSDQPQENVEEVEAPEQKDLSSGERDPKDRSVQIPVETSIRYLQSRAYFQAYGTEPVWVPYRRNFKGQFQPRFTRKSCIRKNRISTGNPCPICRDEYLVVHETNVDLLKQFLSPFNGEVLNWSKTGVCQMQYNNLMVAIIKARDLGLLTHDVPFRFYDYPQYMVHRHD